jgi:hypothetical protein
MVLSFAGVAKGAISISISDQAALANVPAQTSQVVGIGIQNDDGSISFIYLGQNQLGKQRTALGDTIQLFPDAMTIIGLMLAGLQVRYRRTA